MQTTKKKVNKVKFETINKKEVLTKPNGAQSIRDILFRNTQGMAYDNYKTPFYEEQASFSSISMNDLQDMELSEKMQFLKQTAEKAEMLRQKIAEYDQQQKQLIQQAQAEPAEPAQQSA